MSLIVIIEDNTQSSRLATRLLQSAGYDVVVAVDGEMGLATVLDNHPDLILVDLGLPDIDGQTVVAMLHQQDTLGSVPVIAFTAWPEEHAHEMAQAYGCDGVITKPIDTRAFAQQVGEFITRSTAPQL